MTDDDELDVLPPTRCDVAVVVPVLGRPENAGPLAASLAESIEGRLARLIFVVSPDDGEQISASMRATIAYRALAPHGCHAATVAAGWDPGPGDYAKKINLGYRVSTEPWIFTGADDLRFYRRWIENALDHESAQRAGVIGTNDLGNALVISGKHSTHSLVRRSYADAFGLADQPGAIYFEGYDHQYCDNELVQTAQARGVFGFSKASIVEHLHPIWRKASSDATYDRGQEGRLADLRTFREREVLWKR